MNASSNLLGKVIAEIQHSPVFDDSKKTDFVHRLQQVESSALNILFVSQSAETKNAAINAMFPTIVLEENNKNIIPYQLNNLTLWDCPAWMTGSNSQTSLMMEIGALLDERDEYGQPLIDLVVTLADGSENKPYAAFQMLCDHIISERDPATRHQVVVAINYGDVQHADENNVFRLHAEKHKTDWPQQVHSALQTAMKQRFGILAEAIEFEADTYLDRPTNLLALYRAMFEALPAEKAINLLNQDIEYRTNYWAYNTCLSDHMASFENTLFDYVWNKSLNGCRLDGRLGAFVGSNGEELGSILQKNISHALSIN
ncbi:hypothetical protein CS022_02000 [Veronia nyctiphanis]|uniref:Uncharacterized protein n=1 Tax=Veronia nyctiphanis TaxID=1278244 RepID=A0A4Q0YUE3_9GAMM|nr:hypothetical protein [Veronia nyctiphanis]RXJ74405.1 hypothetical protein CS022_02000 [Veronia nyctiphanis]